MINMGIVRGFVYLWDPCGTKRTVRDREVSLLYRWCLFEVWYLCDHTAGELPVIERYPESEVRLEKVTERLYFTCYQRN